MANLKAIRDRIQSVKILRKLQKPCAWWRLPGCVALNNRLLPRVPLPTAWRKCYTVCKPVCDLKRRPTAAEETGNPVSRLLVVCDRGLCGSTTLISSVVAESRANRTKGRGVGLQVCAGGAQIILPTPHPPDASYTGLEQIPTAAEASNIADELLSLFLSKA